MYANPQQAGLGDLGFSLNPLKAIKSVGKAVGSVAKTVGKGVVTVARPVVSVAAKVAPVAVAFIPGIGIPAAAAITAGTKLASGVLNKKSVKQIAEDTIVGGAEGAAAGVVNKTLLKGRGYKTITGTLFKKKPASSSTRPAITPPAPIAGSASAAIRQAKPLTSGMIATAAGTINTKKHGKDFVPPLDVVTRAAVAALKPKTIDPQRPAPETVAPQPDQAATPMLREPEYPTPAAASAPADGGTIFGLPPIALAIGAAAIGIPLLMGHSSSRRGR